MEIRQMILEGKTTLGIEFGSTRIKAVLIGEDNAPIASGSHEWENRYENNIWTYSQEDIWTGLQDCYADMAKDVQEKYGVTLTTVGALGFSAMMHGYLPFDKNGEMLVPFRTWRNTITEEASVKLTEAFHFNIPQRWSIAHLYFGTGFAAGPGNIIDNILCILFAYWTNRTFVFRSRNHGTAALKEFGQFVFFRLLTLVMDQVIITIGVQVVGPAIGFAVAGAASGDAMAPSELWAMGVKLFSQVVVILSNYVFSKLFTFKKKQ